MAAQLAASQEGLSSVSKLVSKLMLSKVLHCKQYQMKNQLSMTFTYVVSI
jgi:hypothetical protein